MRKFTLFAFITLIILGLVFLGTGYTLAQRGNFSPDSPAFPFQKFSEQQMLALLQDPLPRAEYALQLLERRKVALSNLVGSPAEIAALQELNQALDQAILSIAEAPQAGLEGLKTRLALLLLDIETILSRLAVNPASVSELYAAVQGKVLALEKMVGNFAESANAPVPTPETNLLVNPLPTQPASATPEATPIQGLIDPMMVQFPPGSPGAEHQFFPLSGKHAELTCQSCHIDGNYADMKNQCADCHAKVLPAGHYPGLCSDCHFSTTWLEIEYQHDLLVASNCQLCHQKNQPLDHYNGQCSACHNVRAWLPANFNHQVAMATNCRNCHLDNRPNNHYDGQCSACHTTRAWLPANFNHTGQADCQSCHSDDRPSNHYRGQCSACHNTRSWAGATFNHSGQADCQSCHSSDRPANHFSGQCSACHSTSTWQGATFSHQGLKDCNSCHTPPANHWSGQCSQCHSTNGWGSINVSGHGFPMNHGDAGGDCYACHDGAKSNVNCYRCHDRAETEKKHTEEGILDIAGNCLACHPNGEGD